MSNIAQGEAKGYILAMRPSASCFIFYIARDKTMLQRISSTSSYSP